ncbi:hypothetical protein CR164_01245 [Prosthecochloris marina]|uniref:Uncharacterized protein n=1 Tax=Prosthecochloris marina TaxID=2017681 RepID=A0A317T9G7_9CHLB|nr:hypothetical protein CR164_01245 [Prosthecochloris marina]
MPILFQRPACDEVALMLSLNVSEKDSGGCFFASKILCLMLDFIPILINHIWYRMHQNPCCFLSFFTMYRTFIKG